MTPRRCLYAALAVCAPFASTHSAYAQNEQLFADGNAAYLAGEPARAVAAYEGLVAEGVASAELETNLGAAYLRQGKRGQAALHLERALALAPGDEDARADLAELRRTNVDKLEGGDDQGAAEIFIRLLAPLPGGAAAVVLVLAWSFGWALLAWKLIDPGQARAPLGALSIACFALAVACAAVAAGSAAGRAIALRRAVVVAASAAAREGPGKASATPFEVHEGTAVSIEEELAGYSRVKLANGLTGWVETAALERVVPPGWRG